MPEGAGVYVARFRRSRSLGCQFKVFFDFDPRVRDALFPALVSSGFLEPSWDEDLDDRAWVLLAGHGTCKTVDGFVNNYVSDPVVLT